MAEPVANWVMIAYSQLWAKFQEEPFNQLSMEKIVKKKPAPILHELRRAGWIEDVGFNASDSRIRMYKLKQPQEVVLAIARSTHA